MQAKDFYQTSQEGCLPLVLLSQAQFQDDLELQSHFERHGLAAQQFKGRLGDLAIISHTDGLATQIYIGAGDGMDAEAIAHAVNILPPGSYVVQQPLSRSAQIAWSLAQYRFDRYKTNDASPRILSVRAKTLPQILAEASAVFLVRDLINTPSNDLGPKELADVITRIAHEYGAEFKQWVGQALLRDNFPAIHAVGRAAASEPRLLSLRWGDVKHPRVTLVGKGVCFDTGGLDIKPAAGMRLMKKDMGGAAQVIGLAQWIMTQRLPVRLHVLIPAVENAIGANAYRPGDVLTMRNGLRVEVDNTDAEGRLVLADALVRACEDKPDLLIDFATLTGAARVAVGTEISAMFSNHERLALALMDLSFDARDPLWRLPLYRGYASMLDSNIADLVNSSSSSYAGAITAALFLQRFVEESVCWVHFDIMAWNVKSQPGKPEGGEAMGMQAVGHYLLSRYG